MKFQLSREDYELLLLALGIAAGRVSPDNRPLFLSLLQLANTLNKDNPNWTPYAVDEEPAGRADSTPNNQDDAL